MSPVEIRALLSRLLAEADIEWGPIDSDDSNASHWVGLDEGPIAVSVYPLSDDADADSTEVIVALEGAVLVDIPEGNRGLALELLNDFNATYPLARAILHGPDLMATVELPASGLSTDSLLTSLGAVEAILGAREDLQEELGGADPRELDEGEDTVAGPTDESNMETETPLPDQIAMWENYTPVQGDSGASDGQWLYCLKATKRGSRQVVWSGVHGDGLIAVVDFNGEIRHRASARGWEGWGLITPLPQPVPVEVCQSDDVLRRRFSGAGLHALQQTIWLDTDLAEQIEALAGGLPAQPSNLSSARADWDAPGGTWGR